MASRKVSRWLGLLIAVSLLCHAGFASDDETPKRASEVVPGSDLKMEDAMTSAEAIVVATVAAAAEVVNRNTCSISYGRVGGGGLAGGDVLTRVNVRQRFQVSQSLRGAEKGETTLTYSYLESSERKQPESPLNVSDVPLILWLKEKRVMKTLSATPENLATVKKLLSEAKKP